MTTDISPDSQLMVVDDAFAPSVGGSQILLANLLASYPGRAFAAVRRHLPQQEDPDFVPPCPVDRMWSPQNLLLYRVFFRLKYKPPCMWSYRRFLRREAARRWPAAIMAASPAVGMFLSAFQVARRAGIPFYAHMHDLWEENSAPGSDSQKLASRWEKIILTQARRVLCMTDVQADFYRKKYGISSQLLPHTIPPQSLDAAPKGMLQATLPERTVLFVGAVSTPMNLDSLRVLAKASELLPEDVRLLFLTRATKESLADDGIASSRLAARTVSREDVGRLVSACHVLVAPLSHKNGSAEEVRTVFSTKLLEYLLSGRPILVFAPRDSFHAISARQGGWGLVVDEDDPKALADGIVKLLTDEPLCRSLVAGALAEARRRNASTFGRQLHDWVLEDAKERNA